MSGLAALVLGAALTTAPMPPARPDPAPPTIAVERRPELPRTAPGVSPLPRRALRTLAPVLPSDLPRTPVPRGGEDPDLADRPPAGREATPERNAPQMARPAPPAASARAPKVPVCRDPRIEGAMIPSVVHSSWPCGITQPVRVNAIAGIGLSTPATLDCNTATRLATWLTGVVVPAAEAHLGSRVEKLWVMGTYACRRRNNKPSGKLSEHARGRAVDVGGVWLANGRRVTLEDGWGKGADGRFLAQIRGRACGLFHTVLGPGSDRYHGDHLHLDTSPRGGAPYCR